MGADIDPRGVRERPASFSGFKMIPSTPAAILHRIALWILLAVLCSAVIRFMLMLDLNKRVYNHTPGPCRIVPDMDSGSSGMELVKSTGDVFITYGLGNTFGSPKISGGIAIYEFEKENPAHLATKLTIIGEGFDQSLFSPRGISSYHSKGRTILYVINDHPSRKCIEVFVHQKEKHTLLHRKRICDSRFTSLNDIAALGSDRFYVTNTAFFPRGTMQIVEMTVQSSFGSLFLYDGKNVTVAASGLSSPSAIAYDEKRSLLYVGSLLSENIRVYAVEKDLSVTSRLEISLLSSPAGMFIDEASGDIWVALHPVIYQAYLHMKYADDKKIHSPSQVLRIRVQPDGVSWVITEPYANDGATISGSNSVVFYKDQMMVGSLFGRTLHCDVLNAHIT